MSGKDGPPDRAGAYKREEYEMTPADRMYLPADRNPEASV